MLAKSSGMVSAAFVRLWGKRRAEKEKTLSANNPNREGKNKRKLWEFMLLLFYKHKILGEKSAKQDRN